MGDRKSFLDIAMGLDPSGNPAKVFEVLERLYPILTDAPVGPSNARMGNETTIRTSLPAISRLAVNEGIAVSKSSKTKRTDTIAMYGGRAEVDKKMDIVYGPERVADERRKEEMAFIEAMGQQGVADLLYCDENVTSRGFTGFAPRLATLQTSLSGPQVRSMGTVTGGDGSSIYVVDWNQDTGCGLMFPKDGHLASAGGGKLAAAGLRVEPLQGDVEVEDASGRRFRAYVTEFLWAFGLKIEDPRRMGRLANIDTSDVLLASPTQGSLYDALGELLVNMPKADGYQRVMYCNRTVFTGLIRQANNKVQNGGLTREEYLGKLEPHYMGFPIRIVDAITNTESTVS
jgi:hypothetical protein